MGLGHEEMEAIIAFGFVGIWQPGKNNGDIRSLCLLYSFAQQAFICLPFFRIAVCICQVYVATQPVPQFLIRCIYTSGNYLRTTRPLIARLPGETSGDRN